MVLGIGVAPHIPVAARIVARASRLLEPGMLVGGMVQHHFDDYADSALMCYLKKVLEVIKNAIIGMD